VTDNPYVSLVVLIIAVAMGVGGTFMSVLLWIGNRRVEAKVRYAFESALASDPEKARAMVRGFPAVAIACCGMVVAGCTVLLDERSPGSQTTLSEWAGVVGGLIVTLLGVGFDLLIIYYNRPRLVVPPHLRWEPGYNEVVRAREQGRDLDEFYRTAQEEWGRRRLSDAE